MCYSVRRNFFSISRKLIMSSVQTFFNLVQKYLKRWLFMSFIQLKFLIKKNFRVIKAISNWIEQCLKSRESGSQGGNISIECKEFYFPGQRLSLKPFLPFTCYLIIKLTPLSENENLFPALWQHLQKKNTIKRFLSIGANII